VLSGLAVCPACAIGVETGKHEQLRRDGEAIQESACCNGSI
jgi:hypothetical protein